ncbi:MAG: radical SAM protein [Deltaproteobacteria bacterium]|nr:radical SAM protein [Deltaproteobacteria bacterium]
MDEDLLHRLPLVLREEPFGGLLFSPRDAVHLELDRDGLGFVRDYLRGRAAACTAPERELVQRLQAELGGVVTPLTVEYRYPPGPGPYPFQVHAAPTLVDFQITERCTLGCPHCYASAVPEGEHVARGDIELVLRELRRNGVTQIALGGGEPLAHPDLAPVLELCHGCNLVPSLTTSGLLLDRDLLAALRSYCGAVALSLEGVGEQFSRRRHMSFGVFTERLERLLDAGIATVLQVTLSRENFAQLDEIVRFCLGYPALYGVVFLAYKEVGRGRGYHRVLAELPAAQVHGALGRAFAALSRRMRVGYDCCLTPAVAGAKDELALPPGEPLEGCTALRSSIGVLPNLDVVPCTFARDVVVGNLRQQPLAEIWQGIQAERFRQAMQRHAERDTGCASCASRWECLGGCPVFDLVACQRRSNSG